MLRLKPIPIGGHELPPLDYSFNALEPFISEKSLKVHYNVLHRNYVNNLNETELELQDARKNNNFSDIKSLENSLAYNGSGHILHSIFWNNLSPGKENLLPPLFLMSEIKKSFGNYDNFKEQFVNTSLKTEGSCWAALCYSTSFQRLEILQVKNHQNGTQWGSIPIMVLDVWEHAYYFDYLSDRKKYIDNYWSFIDYSNVEKRLEEAIRGNLAIKL